MSSRPPVVVVGAGHAGCEAALAAKRLGRDVVVVTLSKRHVGRLSCNPAVGGLAKGHLVRDHPARQVLEDGVVVHRHEERLDLLDFHHLALVAGEPSGRLLVAHFPEAHRDVAAYLETLRTLARK